MATAAAGVVAGRFVAAACGAELWAGLGSAWLAGSASVFALAWGRSRSPAWFWRAFGFGAALRAGVLVALVAAAWQWPWARAAVLLGAYGFGLAALMLLEFRHLTVEAR